MPVGLTNLGAGIISIIVAASLMALLVEIMCVLSRRGGRVRAEPQEVQQHGMKWECASRMMLSTIKEGEAEGFDSTVSSIDTSAVINSTNKLNQ